MAPIVTRYPLDPTGVSANNKVESEEHTLPSRPIRAIAPSYGAFYTESLKVFEKNNPTPLVPYVDYYPAELYEVPTAKYGKEICSVIVITNANVGSDIIIDYQALGGPWSYSQQAIIQMINNLDLDNRPVSWGDIIGKPTEFNPAHHLHDAGDIYGFEYIVAELERIYQAIIIGDSVSHDLIYKYIDDALANFLDGATFTGPIVGSITSLAMIKDDVLNNGSFIARATGEGAENLAGMTLAHSDYLIKFGVDSDGKVALGGGDAEGYRWYNDAQGDSYQIGDCFINSDPTLKENQVPIENALQKLGVLTGYTFNWRGLGPKKFKQGQKDYGIMTDELKKVFPEMVKKGKWKENEVYEMASYEKLIPVLIQGIKELNSLFIDLKAENIQLKNVLGV